MNKAAQVLYGIGGAMVVLSLAALAALLLALCLAGLTGSSVYGWIPPTFFITTPAALIGIGLLWLGAWLEFRK